MTSQERSERSPLGSKSLAVLALGLGGMVWLAFDLAPADPGPSGPPSGTLVLAQASTDSDGDGVEDPQDNCPQIANALQEDNDGDAFGDACDPDSDGDGFCDGANPGGSPCTPTDNCPHQYNPSQDNADAHPAGDLCQCGDVTGEGVVDTDDVDRIHANFFAPPPAEPFDIERCDVVDDDVESCGVGEKAKAQRWLALGNPAELAMVCKAYTTAIGPPDPPPPPPDPPPPPAPPILIQN